MALGGTGVGGGVSETHGGRSCICISVSRRMDVPWHLGGAQRLPAHALSPGTWVACAISPRASRGHYGPGRHNHRPMSADE